MSPSSIEIRLRSTSAPLCMTAVTHASVSIASASTALNDVRRRVVAEARVVLPGEVRPRRRSAGRACVVFRCTICVFALLIRTSSPGTSRRTWSPGARFSFASQLGYQRYSSSLVARFGHDGRADARQEARERARSRAGLRRLRRLAQVRADARDPLRRGPETPSFWMSASKSSAACSGSSSGKTKASPTRRRRRRSAPDHLDPVRAERRRPPRARRARDARARSSKKAQTSFSRKSGVRPRSCLDDVEELGDVGAEVVDRQRLGAGGQRGEQVVHRRERRCGVG